MFKLGRNDPCPCGSGKKFKKCCYGKSPATAAKGDAAEKAPHLLTSEIEKIQARAAQREPSLYTTGVFLFFSTADGDAWMLDMTAMDALQVASGATHLPAEIIQNDQAIEITWSHRFAIRDKKFVAMSYRDHTEAVFPDYPATRIGTLIGKARQRLSPELIESVHLGTAEVTTPR